MYENEKEGGERAVLCILFMGWVVVLMWEIGGRPLGFYFSKRGLGGLLGFLLGFSASWLQFCLLAWLMAHGIPRSRRLYFFPVHPQVSNCRSFAASFQTKLPRGIRNHLYDSLAYYTVDRRPLRLSFVLRSSLNMMINLT